MSHQANVKDLLGRKIWMVRWYKPLEPTIEAYLDPTRGGMMTPLDLLPALLVYALSEEDAQNLVSGIEERKASWRKNGCSV